VCGIRSSKRKKKFQTGLSDSQINDSKVSTTPAMYPVSNCKNLIEAAQIADRWNGYCEDLYHDEEGNGTEQEYWKKEPPPLCSEVARAIRQTASRKATGLDDIPAAVQSRRMHRICVAIWETGE